MLSRKFTERERILIAVLAVLLALGVYFIAIWSPSEMSKTAAHARLVEWETMLIAEQAKAAKLNEMRGKLEEIGYGEIATAMTPEYDNAENVVRLLDSALGKAGQYDMRFSPIAISEKFALREISMTFAADSYETAKDIVLELASGPYSCDISALGIEPSDSALESIDEGGVNVTLVIVYYETYRG